MNIVSMLKKMEKGDLIIVCVYVGDLIFIGSNSTMFDELKKDITTKLKMSDIGIMSYYLGIEIK